MSNDIVAKKTRWKDGVFSTLTDQFRKLSVDKFVNSKSGLEATLEVKKKEIKIFGSYNRMGGFSITISSDGMLYLEVPSRGVERFRYTDDVAFRHKISIAEAGWEEKRAFIAKVLNDVESELHNFDSLKKQFPLYRQPLIDWIMGIDKAAESMVPEELHHKR
ncbi:MAG: hypothetical protein KGH61_05195 [Candidatus Micrarchaeota archaeon]|nr:hypothetical protein [Candidatus Micrarchaeota archaeon]MDE1848310.1 hypothetical protein [Candidatus Micrarchaeota archaeon]